MDPGLPIFTIFTATYNRANTIHRVYDGLSKQTFKDFEWLIIDDGSTDNTGEIVTQWIQEAKFAIRYYWQENRGKHIAHNVALQKAQGKYFVIIDSDDSIIPVALERLITLWESIPEGHNSDFCGAAALCMDQNGEIIGESLPEPVIDASILEMRFIHKLSQEFVGFYKTTILRQFPFPKIENVRFIPEGYVWSQIGQKYKIRYGNEPLRIYFTEDHSNSLMKMNPMKLARSHSLWHKFTLNSEISWFWYGPKHFLASAAHFIRFSLHNKNRLVEQFTGLENWLARVLWLLTLPIGISAFFIDKKLRR